MQDPELKSALQVRRKKLAAEIQSLTRQLKACDTMLAGLESGGNTPTEIPAGEDGAADRAAPSAASENLPRANALPEEPPDPAPTLKILAPPPLSENQAPPSPPIAAVPQNDPPRYAPTPEELAEITALANSNKRGRRMARVELAIAECGDTFSLHDVMKVFRTQFGWRGNPVADMIASAFWKVVQKRGYRIIRTGTGRSPTIYGK